MELIYDCDKYTCMHCIGILCSESYIAPVLAERALRDHISGNGAALKKHTAGFSETLARDHLPTHTASHSKIVVLFYTVFRISILMLKLVVHILTTR
jgi:hypothetical protein